MNDPTGKKSGARWSDFHILDGDIPEKLRRRVRCWKFGLNTEVGEERGRYDDGVGFA